MRYESVIQKIGQVLYHASGILFIALSSCMSLQIALRYLANTSLPWMEDLNRFLMVWLGFIGAAACSHRGKHIKFGLDLIGKISSAASKYVFMAILFPFTLFLGLLFVVGIKVCAQNMNVYSSALPIPFGILMIIIPLMSALMFIFHARELVVLWRQRRDS